MVLVRSTERLQQESYEIQPTNLPGMLPLLLSTPNAVHHTRSRHQLPKTKFSGYTEDPFYIQLHLPTPKSQAIGL